MIDCWVDEHEWYPIYTLIFTHPFAPWPADATISEEDRADYHRVMSEFRAWQDRLSDIADPEVVQAKRGQR